MARILVVDDSKLMRKRLSDILQIAGHTVVRELGRGDQVLDAYATFQPDLVTMDVNMPGMSGIDALKELKHHYPKAKVVLISSENHELVIMDGIKSGALNYIIKPFQDENVIRIISKIVSPTESRKPTPKRPHAQLMDYDEDITGLILLIDDSRLSLQATSDLLKSDGHNILMATSGKLGLDLAVNGTPDLILLDVVMPDIDGYEVFRMLRSEEITKNIPIIIYSSLTQKEDILTAMKMGINEYISKNCDEDILKRKVKSTLFQAKMDKQKHEDLAVQNIIITQKEESVYMSFRFSLKSDSALEERIKIFSPAFIKSIEEKNLILDFRQITDMNDEELKSVKYIYSLFPTKKLLIVCGKHYSAFAMEFDMEGKNEYFISVGDLEVYLEQNRHGRFLEIVETDDRNR